MVSFFWPLFERIENFSLFSGKGAVGLMWAGWGHGEYSQLWSGKFVQPPDAPHPLTDHPMQVLKLSRAAARVKNQAILLNLLLLMINTIKNKKSKIIKIAVLKLCWGYCTLEVPFLSVEDLQLPWTASAQRWKQVAKCGCGSLRNGVQGFLTLLFWRTTVCFPKFWSYPMGRFRSYGLFF